jgi:glycerol kinase
MRETTALGAAFAAGLCVGVWKDIAAIQKLNVEDASLYKSSMSLEGKRT